MKTDKKFLTCDGNYAAAHVAYMFSEVAAIYPITPSSTMAEYVDEWSAAGRKNIFGETVKVVEMQSEAGAAGAVHGSLQTGALTTTYTASQGLLLMIPNMYKIAGELLPGVFHVSARALAASTLSIFGDHQDVMATRQTGFAMLATGSVQEVMDLAGVAHLASLRSRVPFVHFFDGFRTSHEIQKIEVLENGDLEPLMDKKALAEFRARALNPEAPVTRGTAQNSDIYFQSREAGNRFWDAVPDVVAEYMREISKITGREYKPFTYYGDPAATDIVVAMGSITEVLRETVDYLNKNGRKVGVVTVHLYRPFSVKYLEAVVPTTAERVCVLDRTKEAGAHGEPLYLDVVEALRGRKLNIIGGRYGLSSKDTTPADMVAVYDNLAGEARNGFTVGIVDDVTHLSLTTGAAIDLGNKGTFEGLFFGLGADGTVGANKNSIKIIGGTTDKYCQAYFAYDSKKSGGYTASHLRFGDSPIRSPYLVTTPDFVACHVPSYIHKYDVLKGLKKGGSFLLNTSVEADRIGEELSDEMKACLAKNDINFYIIDATKIASELGLGNRTNTIMQSAFFKIARVIPFETAVEEMKKAIKKSYGIKGDAVVAMNNAAVDAGGDAVVKVDVPASWRDLTPSVSAVSSEPTAMEAKKKPAFVRDVVEPVNNLKGDTLPVSAFAGREDGTWDNGTAAWEKRGIAVNVPCWVSENCIQCNQCSYVCPHAAIRPFLATDAEVAGAPAGTEFKQGLADTKDYKFRIQVSPLDCTGCNNCVDVCPAKTKALVMRPLATQKVEEERWSYMHSVVGYKEVVDKTKNVKNSQFAQPLFEFSGACAGCGETPYIKTVTQLFGDQMVVANATGCTSIYSGSAPSTPYCVNVKGRGPAWANSLFEDNAEFGLGMQVATEKLRDRLEILMKRAIAECKCCSAELKATMGEWISHRSDRVQSRELADKLVPMMEACGCATCREILAMKQYLAKRSQWIIGGDGWAYDIGFGGLDHVLASGLDVNVLVLDTEVYSNTGGQSSKATPVGAIAKFASSGKRVRKKDLGAIAMTYGYVYVAQVSIGASQNQLLKVLKEAESYNGPSLVIAYAPCINHGIKGGMTRTPTIGKEAVESGYWHLWHFDPRLAEAGENPFVMDSKEPDWSKFRAFLDKEVRYTALSKSYPAEAEELFAAAQENAKWRYDGYRRLAELKY